VLHDMPLCPICGEETDTVYKDYFGNIVGCDMCVKAYDAWEELDEEDYT